jgi:DNA-directed RNA polymerase specialized sigma24 family protein
LVVLETLQPAERLAFVLHDMFAVPFEEIAPIVGRSVEASRPHGSPAPRRCRTSAESSMPSSRRRAKAISRAC